MKVLFLGCHCDDIELGCGATIHKHKDNWDITCAILSKTGPFGKYVNLAKISSQSLKSLGVENFHFYDFPVQDFWQKRQEIWEKLKQLDVNICPDLVITQMKDEQQDHVVLYDESLRVFRRKTVLTYIPAYRSAKIFDYDTVEVVSEVDVVAKLNALRFYQEIYSSKNYFSLDNLKSHLRVNGIYVEEKFAETYKTVIRINL